MPGVVATTKRVGHVALHVLVKTFSTWPAGQVVHAAAVEVQVWQLALHGWQVAPTWNVLGGHVGTHVVPLSSGVPEPAKQPVQPAELVQVAHGNGQATHAVPFE